MRIFRFFVVFTISLSALVSGPAAAESQDEFFALTCDAKSFSGRLQKLNTDFLGANEVGNFNHTSSTEITCAGPGTYNPADGHFYWVSWAGRPGKLIKTNSLTGESTYVGTFSLASGDFFNTYVDGIAIGKDGRAFVPVKNVGIYELDLTTAEITPVALMEFGSTYGVAFDPTTEKYIVATSLRDFYEFSPESSALIPITSGHYFNLLSAFDGLFYDLDFDSAGNAYLINGYIQRVSATDYTLTTFSQNDLNLFGEAIYAESLIIKFDYVVTPTFVNKRIWAIKDGKLTSAGKAKIRQVSANRDAATIVCSVRKRRDFSVSFKLDSRAAQVLASQACAIASAGSPDADVITRGWVVGKKPGNTLHIQFK